MEESEELVNKLILDRANKPYERDKRLNTPAFNRIVKIRRAKAKQAKAARKKNRK